MEPIVVLGAAAVVGSLFVLWWAVSGGRGEPVQLRASDDYPTDMQTLVLQQSVTDRAVTPLLERIGGRLRRWSPAGRVRQLGIRISRAGSPEGWTVERILAVKVLLALSFGLLYLLVFISRPTLLNLLLTIGFAVSGYFLPNALLDRRAEQRRLAIRSELSDTIDQLAVMVRAGLGIDAAISRTARAGSGPFNQELARVVQDMRVGVDRGVALTNMADRIDVPELRSFVAALAQAERLGVPVAQTLQLQSDEMRVKRRQLAEERAMKLPVKILFPTVFCILPTIFLVVLGPAAIRIFEELG